MSYTILFSVFSVEKFMCFEKSYAAFTLSGFVNQERNLTFVKTTFQVSKLKFA